MDEKEVEEIRWLRAFLDRQVWIFARTYADKSPHEYCLFTQGNGTEEEFRKAAELVRKYGIRMHYYQCRAKKYFFYGGRMYWDMEERAEDVRLINRSECDSYRITVSWNNPKDHLHGS